VFLEIFLLLMKSLLLGFPGIMVLLLNLGSLHLQLHDEPIKELVNVFDLILQKLLQFESLFVTFGNKVFCESSIAIE